MSEDYGVDPELVMEFVDESEELLNDVTNLFITLESNPNDKEALDQIFRTVHTIKGNSAFFNLMKVKSMAHINEDLMTLVREGNIAFDEMISDVLIRGIDCLKDMLANVREGKAEVDDENSFNALIDEIRTHVDGAKDVDPVQIWENVNTNIAKFQNHIEQLNDEIKMIWTDLVANLALISPIAQNDDAETEGALDDAAPVEETITPPEDNPKSRILAIISQDIDGKLDDETAQSVLNDLNELKSVATQESQPLIEKSLEAYNRNMEKDGFTKVLSVILSTYITKIEFAKDPQEAPKESSVIDTEEQPTAVVEEKAPAEKVEDDKNKGAAKSNKTMRVYESSIDTFLDFVGELVVVGEMYDHLQKRFSEDFGPNKTIADFRKNNQTFNELSNALQASVLDIRRVPIKSLLQKAPRIIRDVASMKGKKIKVQFEGEETLIDKSLLESIEGPFVHMVRNAADHGIEKPETRLENDKPEEGTVVIAVEETEDLMFIKIIDDGGGLNPDILKHKAIENGVHTEESIKALSDNEIYHLIFAPGFSTAEEVTDISGRGVGMDVVKRSIESIDGQIIIDSKLGEGSTFIIQIPKTVCVKIMEGFLVKSANNRFVLPMISVGESFHVKQEQITNTVGKGKCLLHHDHVYPVMDLDKRLNLIHTDISPDDVCDKIGVMVDVSDRRIIVLVDEVLGTQQVVIKEIEGLPKKPDIVAGGAVMGDEAVAIVLDVNNF